MKKDHIILMIASIVLSLMFLFFSYSFLDFRNLELLVFLKKISLKTIIFNFDALVLFEVALLFPYITWWVNIHYPKSNFELKISNSFIKLISTLLRIDLSLAVLFSINSNYLSNFDLFLSILVFFTPINLEKIIDRPINNFFNKINLKKQAH